MNSEKYYSTEGDKLTDELCPTGFRFFTNRPYISKDRNVIEETIQFIKTCREIYGDVAIIPAFASTTPAQIDHNGIGICVRAVEPLRCGIGSGCEVCHKQYRLNDTVLIKSRKNEEMGIDKESVIRELCLNHFNFYSYNRNEKGVYVEKHYW